MKKKEIETMKEHNVRIKNPELHETLQATAFNHPHINKIEQVPFLRLEDDDKLTLIDKEAYHNDYASYWQIHINKLFFISSLCLLYLSFKLFGA